MVWGGGINFAKVDGRDRPWGRGGGLSTLVKLIRKMGMGEGGNTNFAKVGG